MPERYSAHRTGRGSCVLSMSESLEVKVLYPA